MKLFWIIFLNIFFKVPEGSSVHEDGSIVAADGTILAPPGSVIVGEDGTLMMTQDGAMLMQGDQGAVSEPMEEQAYQQMVEQQQQQEQQQQPELAQSGQIAEGDSGGGGVEGGGVSGTVSAAENGPEAAVKAEAASEGGVVGAAGEQINHEGAPVAKSESSMFASDENQSVANEGQAEATADGGSQFGGGDNHSAEEGQPGDSSQKEMAANQPPDGQMMPADQSLPDTAVNAGEEVPGQGEGMALAANSILPTGSEALSSQENAAVMYTSSEVTPVQETYGRQAIYTTADGTVVSAPEGTLMANAEGNLVTADGTVLTTEDGTPVSLHGSVLAHTGAGKFQYFAFAFL
jgi:hypothetical protein